MTDSARLCQSVDSSLVNRPGISSLRRNQGWKRDCLRKVVIVMMRYIAIALMVLGFAAQGFSQRITDLSNGTLSATLAFGTLTPGTSTVPASQTVQFRIRSSNLTGYNIQVISANFTPTPTAPLDGGS